ncbi:ATP-binding protein [Dietzia sp. NPDC055877]
MLVFNQVDYIPFDSDTTNLFFRLESLPYDRRRIVATLTTPIGRWGRILAGELVAAGMTGRLVVTHAAVLAPTKSPPSSDPQAGLLMLGAPDSISATKPPNTAPRFVSPPSPAPRPELDLLMGSGGHRRPSLLVSRIRVRDSGH